MFDCVPKMHLLHKKEKKKNKKKQIIIYDLTQFYMI